MRFALSQENFNFREVSVRTLKKEENNVINPHEKTKSIKRSMFCNQHYRIFSHSNQHGLWHKHICLKLLSKTSSSNLGLFSASLCVLTELISHRNSHCTQTKGGRTLSSAFSVLFCKAWIFETTCSKTNEWHSWHEQIGHCFILNQITNVNITKIHSSVFFPVFKPKGTMPTIWRYK